MLVEINLLPKKSKKGKTIFIIIGIIVFLLVLVSAFFIWQIQSKEAVLADTQNRLDITYEYPRRKK